jgi:maltose alpha-D-glucosyltransferase/alpha-amylase
MNLNTQKLIDQLPTRRWFGDKGRTIERAELVDCGIIEDGVESLALVILRVRFTDSTSSLYHLPLLVSENGDSRDATDDPGRLSVIGELLAHGHPVKGDKGTFHFSGPGLDPSAPPGSDVRTMGVEQSNTSVVFDEDVVLKFFRKVESGSNPDLELCRLLTNEAFKSIPTQLGEIFYEGEGDDGPIEIDLGIAQRFVSDSREGWDYILEGIAGVLEEIHPEDVAEDRAVLIEQRSSDLLAAIEQLGEATAGLHIALSREDVDLDLRREPIEATDLTDWVESANQRLRRLMEANDELQQLAPQIEERLKRVTIIEDPGSKIRVHGDFHLGQVLRIQRGWLILDFEGEPARSLKERRAKQSPLKDVAGMLRSISYAAYSSLFNRCDPGSEEWGRLEPWALGWASLARDRFLGAYATKSHEGRFLPGDRESLTVLLDFFVLDKALYEVDYEMHNRPDWLQIPLRGIASVIEGSELL